MKRLSILLSVAIFSIFLNIEVGAYTWYSYNGHQYAVTNNEGLFWECENEAQSQGGHLVTINDQSEQDWLVANFPQEVRLYDYKYYWIGLYQTDPWIEPDQTWVWTSGEPVTYTNWNWGEPNDNWGEDLAIMYPDGTWNDIYSQTSTGIIEKTAASAPIPSAIILFGTALIALSASKSRSFISKD
jgi:hypothetical protein